MKLQNLIKNAKWAINERGKRGSYIVEAAVGLPLLILSVIALSFIIKIVGICENIGFVTIKEIRDINLYATQDINSPHLCKLMIEDSVYDSNPALTDFRVTNLDYLFTEKGIHDLIAIDSKANFSVSNPIGINGKIQFDLSVLSRAFTGTERQGTPLGREKFNDGSKSKKVIIFPKYGIRFHTRNCRYVRQDYAGEECKLEMELEDAKAKGHTPCEICRGGER